MKKKPVRKALTPKQRSAVTQRAQEEAFAARLWDTVLSEKEFRDAHYSFPVGPLEVSIRFTGGQPSPRDIDSTIAFLKLIREQKEPQGVLALDSTAQKRMLTECQKYYGVKCYYQENPFGKTKAPRKKKPRKAKPRA